MKSSTKAWVTLSLFSTVLVVIGHILGGRQGLLWGMTIALSVNCLIYFYSDQRILSSFKGLLVEGQDPWSVSKVVARLAQKARLPRPTVIVIEANAPQAFSVGRTWKAGTLVITTGLLESFTEDEVEAVVAYLMATIKRQDTLAFAVTSAFCAFALSITLRLDIMTRWLLGAKKGSTSVLSHPFTYFLGPLLYPFLRFTVSADNYYSADALATHYLDNPKKMAQILWKLNSYRVTKPFAVPASMAHLFIVNPLTSKGWGHYFQSQPSAENRIRKLLGYYPI